MSARASNGSGEGLSIETLLVAAIASAVAAIVVSQFWQGGTPIAAAITPVVVALVSEGLRRPMRSERVRSTTRRAVEPLRRTGTGSQPVQRRVGEDELGYTVYGEGADARTGGDAEPGSRSGNLLERVRAGLTPKRARIAVVTGLLAFVAAAAVLTLPELLFGGSVSGERDTTLFGGGKDDERNGKDERDGGGSGDGRDRGSDGSPGSSPSGGDQPEDSQPPSSESPPEDQPPPTEPAPQPPTETQPLP